MKKLATYTFPFLADDETPQIIRRQCELAS